MRDVSGYAFGFLHCLRVRGTPSMCPAPHGPRERAFFIFQRDRAPGKRPVPRTESRCESAGAAFPGASALRPQTGGLMHRNLQSPSPGDQKSHIKAAAKPAPAEARGELCTGPRPVRWRSWGSSAHDAAVISTRPSLCAHVSTRPLSQGHQYVGVRLTLLCTTSR